MAASETKLYAQFRTAGYSGTETVEIKSVQEAVDYGLKKNCANFQTFEVTEVDLNGEVLKGGPKNQSDTYHLNVDKLLTAADIAASFEKKVAELRPAVLQDQATLKSMSYPFAGSYQQQKVYHQFKDKVDRNETLINSYAAMREHFSTLPPDRLFFEDPHGRRGEYVEVGQNDVVFNKSGQQICSQPTAPGSKPATAAAEKQQQLQAQARKHKLNIRPG